jgi:acyl-[acyl carrier protein]--UDP-N-acetylglucosamine O-acyltransferase
VFVIAAVLDVVYQFVAIGSWRPLQALTAALLLAVIPYVLMRGPVNRLSGGGKS